MKIFLIDNSAVVKRGNTYNTNSLNGLFLSDIISCGNNITYFQFAYETENSINNFDLIANGVNYRPFKLYKNKIIRYIFAYLAVIPYILNNDFIYIYYPSSFRYVAFLCKLFRKKFGLYIRGEQGVNDFLSKKIYLNAFTIFTVSDNFTNFVNRVVGKKIANTIRPMILFSEKDIVYNRSYIENGIFNILFLGRIAKDKGIKELLYAVNILKNKGYKFKLSIVGNGEYFVEAEEIIKSLKIQDIACLKGSINQQESVKDYYSKADIYILPTYHEGFPRTLYEAMIFGTPIITTLVGGIPGLMIEGVNCKEIKPKSVSSIIDGLEFAFNNYTKMIEYAKKGRETVKSIVDSRRLSHAQHLNKILKDDRKDME